MRTRKVFRMPLDKILCLSANAILTIIALWSIASVFFENATIDSIIARFSVASACMANLFSKHRLIRIIFLIMAFVLIIVATALYVHKANKMSLSLRVSFAEVAKPLLEDGRFLQPHRSYVVNLAAAQLLTAGELQMCSGARIPIPRGREGAVREAFRSWIDR